MANATNTSPANRAASGRHAGTKRPTANQISVATTARATEGAKLVGTTTYDETAERKDAKCKILSMLETAKSVIKAPRVSSLAKVPTCVAAKRDMVDINTI